MLKKLWNFWCDIIKKRNEDYNEKYHRSPAEPNRWKPNVLFQPFKVSAVMFFLGALIGYSIPADGTGRINNAAHCGFALMYAAFILNVFYNVICWYFSKTHKLSPVNLWRRWCKFCNGYNMWQGIPFYNTGYYKPSEIFHPFMYIIISICILGLRKFYIGTKDFNESFLVVTTIYAFCFMVSASWSAVRQGLRIYHYLSRNKTT